MESDSSEEQNEAIVTKIMKLKYDLTYDAFREVTFQEHKTEKPCPEKPLKRTLFLSKVPPWANESGLQRIFECNGQVQKVFLAKKASSGLTDEDSRDYSGVDRFLFPTKDTSGFKFAYVVYERPSSVTKALNTMDLSHPYILSDEENPIVTGIKKWKREYNQSIIPESEFDNLKTSIEEFVHATDTKRQERDDKAEEEAEPNDDGWVTVSKKSRKKSTLGAGKSEKVRARMQARAAKRQKNKELRNFYKHASKENKLVKLQELRDKFEADKEKQKKLIADRKFRPAQNCVK